MKKFNKSFEENLYTYIPNFLNEQNCKDYVSEFKKLIDQGSTRIDPQCTLSQAIGGVPLFDSLLEQLIPSMQEVSGKKLYPTYSYARWYVPGDELKIHKDRPSCEISATITLGFEGNPWPIFMGYDDNKEDCREISMKVGDAVIYKGDKVHHWREKYVEGQWQAQVFLHYVDAEGPNAYLKYEKRNSLSHHKIDVPPRSICLVYPNSFSQKSCEQIINTFDKKIEVAKEAELFGNIVDKNIRDTKKILTPFDHGVGATLAGIGLAANNDNWKFNVTNANQCEYLYYDKKGHFSPHIDTNFAEFNDQMRKLTIIAFLNKDYEGGKLWIQVGSNKLYPDTSQGNVIIFPSFFLHGVEPITKGIRRSIVCWLVGPNFK
jgi:hypothetical protein